MNEPMKLIEGMKKLKVLEKHMDRNTDRITQYSSGLSNEKTVYDDEQEQRKAVSGLIQSNKDILNEYLHLKRRVDTTNQKTTVTIGTKEYQLVDLLVLRRGMGKKIEQTYGALNTRLSENRLNSMRVPMVQGEKPPHVVRFYDEQKKYDELQEWQTLMDEIEQRLEVINATTELLTI